MAEDDQGQVYVKHLYFGQRHMTPTPDLGQLQLVLLHASPQILAGTQHSEVATELVEMRR